MHIRFLVFIFYLTSLSAKDCFISNDEYAKMLYNNPRGIGCNKCHGERGEGKVISSYISKNQKLSLIGPRINNISKKKFLKALKKGKRLMPEYFLTKQEKAYLFFYLQKQNKQGEKIAKQSKK